MITREDLWVEWRRSGQWYGRSIKEGAMPAQLIAEAIDHLQTTPARYFVVPNTDGQIRIKLRD